MTNTNRCIVLSITTFLLIYILQTLHADVLNKIIAKVNGEPIMLSEYNRNRDTIIEQYRNAMPDFFKQKDAKEQLEKKVLDQMIDDVLLKQKAENMKIKVFERDIDNGVTEIKKRFQVDETGKRLNDTESETLFINELKKENFTMAQFREKLRKQIMIRKFIDETVRPKVRLPTDEQVNEFFKKIKFIINGDTSTIKDMDEENAQDITIIAQKFKEITGERIRARHILFKVEDNANMVEKNKVLKKAQGVKKEIDSGTDFEELAQKYSDDKESAQKGGDLGYIVKGWMLPEFESKAFSINVGEVSEPVETKFGYHIIKIEEKRAAQKLKLENVRDEIEQYLVNSEFRKELLKLVKELKTTAKIQIFSEDKN